MTKCTLAENNNGGFSFSKPIILDQDGVREAAQMDYNQEKGLCPLDRSQIQDLMAAVEASC